MCPQGYTHKCMLLFSWKMYECHKNCCAYLLSCIHQDAMKRLNTRKYLKRDRFGFLFIISRAKVKYFWKRHSEGYQKQTICNKFVKYAGFFETMEITVREHNNILFVECLFTWRKSQCKAPPYNIFNWIM